jgi:hypothetical protein
VFTPDPLVSLAAPGDAHPAPARPALGSRLWSALALAALMAAALGWRLASASRGGLWRDEALTLAIIGAPDFWGYAFQHDSHPPLYYLLNHLAGIVFGPGESTSLGLSVACGVLLVPAMWAVGTRAFSPTVGWAGALVAVSLPLAVEYSGVLRPYSLLPLLTLLAVFTLWGALHRESRSQAAWWIAHAAFTTALLYSHNWGLLIAMAQAIVAVLYGLIRRPERRTIGFWLVTQVGIALLYAPWIPVLLEQMRHAGHPPGPLLLPGDPGRTLQNLLDAWQLFARCLTGIGHGLWASLVLAAALVGAGFALTRDHGRHNSQHVGAVALFGGVPLVSFALAFGLSTHSNLFFAKCLLALAPPAVLLMLHAIVTLSHRKWLTAAIIGALALTHAAETRRLLSYPKTNAPDVAAAVAALLQPGDLVVVSPEWMASSFNHYFPPQSPQIVFPAYGQRTLVSFRDVAARLADPVAYSRAAARIDAQRAAGGRVWLVTDTAAFGDNRPLTTALDLPPGMDARDYYAIGHWRTRQLTARLVERFGEPRWVSPPSARLLAYESVTALRFDPPAARKARP